MGWSWVWGGGVCPRSRSGSAGGPLCLLGCKTVISEVFPGTPGPNACFELAKPGAHAILHRKPVTYKLTFVWFSHIYFSVSNDLFHSELNPKLWFSAGDPP